MMAAHSLLDSICASDAFCTLRILPRIGSSAWKPELRAALAVPRCGVTLDDEQFGHVVIAAAGSRTSLAGMEADSERVLAACDLLGLARLDAGVHFADDLLQHAAGLFLVARAWSR